MRLAFDAVFRCINRCESVSIYILFKILGEDNPKIAGYLKNQNTDTTNLEVKLLENYAMWFYKKNVKSIKTRQPQSGKLTQLSTKTIL